jgi:hypothetical protein
MVMVIMVGSNEVHFTNCEPKRFHNLRKCIYVSQIAQSQFVKKEPSVYEQIVKNLTKEQIDALVERGIVRSTMSAWRHGKRIPTRAQAIHLAEICKVDVMELEKELMILEVTPEQRDLFQRLLSVPTSAMASLFLVFGVVILGIAPEKSQANQTPSVTSLEIAKSAGNIHRGKLLSRNARCAQKQKT